ncbi:MAG: PLD nuclease N-terminal domain-containing protein [Prosthecochloris sp.]|nr:PLD nuclease N-terminal domain-containing protein [Prosthecochloris sp.]
MGLEGILGIIVLVLDIYAVLNIFQSSASTIKKTIWIALVILLPVFGLILWFLLGPKNKA